MSEQVREERLLSDDPDLRIEIEGIRKKFFVGQADPEIRIRARWGDHCGSAYPVPLYQIDP